MAAHARRTRAFSEDGHARRVAAERADVFAHPAQRESLVRQPKIAGAATTVVRSEGVAAEEAQGAESVVQRHDDDGGAEARSGSRQPVTRIIGATAGDEGT